MTPSRVVTAGLVASALLLAPVSSALADGPRGKSASRHGSSYHGGGYRGPVWHGAGHRAPYAYGGGGYWRGGVWWPFAAVGAVVGTAAAIVAAPFVAFGNAVASAPYYAPQQQYYAPQGYVVPQQPYYAPQQQYYAPQGYNAPRPAYAPQQTYYAPQGYNAQPAYGDATPPPDYSAQRTPPQYYNSARTTQGYAPPPQRSYSPPPAYNAPPDHPPANTTYQQPDPEYYSYNYPR